MMKRAALIAFGVLLVGGVIWRFPLFHVVAIRQSQSIQASFDAKHAAREFWNGPLRASFDEAADAAAVVESLRERPQTVREQFGRTVGLSRDYYLFLRGAGTIVSIEPKLIGLVLEADSDSQRQSPPTVLLSTGLVFGNALRDATGLLRASDYANSQHFNDLSTALNRIVETEVLPALKAGAAVGMTIRFVACAEVNGSSGERLPLVVVPIHFESEPRGEARTSEARTRP